VERML